MLRLAFEMKLEEFTSMILPIKDKLYRFSLNIVGNVAEAEDVVQEVFIKLWKKSSEMSVINNKEAWCMTLTKNLSLDKLRSKHRRAGFIHEGFEVSSNAATP